MKEEIIAQADRLAGLIAVNLRRIDEIEKEMLRQVGSVSADGMRRLHTSKRIVSALEQRLDSVRELLTKGGEHDLRAAKSLLDSRLVVADNPMTTLITADPLPPIQSHDLERALNSLMSGIRVVRRRAPLG